MIYIIVYLFATLIGFMVMQQKAEDPNEVYKIEDLTNKHPSMARRPLIVPLLLALIGKFCGERAVKIAVVFVFVCIAAFFFVYELQMYWLYYIERKNKKERKNVGNTPSKVSRVSTINTKDLKRKKRK